MIDDRILSYAAKLQAELNQNTAGAPLFELDFSWPSVGVVDLALADLKGRSDLSDEELELVRNASAYLAVLTYDAWSRFPDCPQVALLENETRDVCLEARGGRHLPHGAKYELNMTKALRRVLALEEPELKIFPSFSRRANAAHNLLSPLCLSAATGLCPYGEGTWARLEHQNIVEQLLSAQAFLADKAALFYRRMFPHEPHGAEPALYYAGLVLPPAGCEEDLFGLLAAKSLIDYARTHSLSEGELARIAFNLARSPDELSAVGGLIVSAVFADLPPSSDLRLLFDARAHLRSALRPAIVAARTLLGRPNDWIRLAQAGDLSSAHRLLETELALGILPLWRLPTEFLGDAQLMSLFFALAGDDAETALRLIDEIPEEKDGLSLKLQRLHLLIHLGRISEAQEQLNSMPSELRAVRESSALVSLITGDIDRAIEQYRSVLGCAEDEDQIEERAVDCLIPCLLSTDSVQELLDLLEGRERLSLLGEIASVRALLTQERRAEAETRIIRLSRIPHPQVYALNRLKSADAETKVF